ncbi:MAG: hypothetical protein ABIG20_02870 [archaeon]
MKKQLIVLFSLLLVILVAGCVGGGGGNGETGGGSSNVAVSGVKCHLSEKSGDLVLIQEDLPSGWTYLEGYHKYELRTATKTTYKTESTVNYESDIERSDGFAPYVEMSSINTPERVASEGVVADLTVTIEKFTNKNDADNYYKNKKEIAGYSSNIDGSRIEVSEFDFGDEGFIYSSLGMDGNGDPYLTTFAYYRAENLVIQEEISAGHGNPRTAVEEDYLETYADLLVKKLCAPEVEKEPEKEPEKEKGIVFSDICDRLEDIDNKMGCEAIIREDLSLCNSLKKDIPIFSCERDFATYIREIAVKQKDESICVEYYGDKLKSGSYATVANTYNCLGVLAVIKEDPRMCEEYSDLFDRRYCLQDVLQRIILSGNKEACSLFTEKSVDEAYLDDHSVISGKAHKYEPDVEWVDSEAHTYYINNDFVGYCNYLISKDNICIYSDRPCFVDFDSNDIAYCNASAYYASDPYGVVPSDFLRYKCIIEKAKSASDCDQILNDALNITAVLNNIYIGDIEQNYMDCRYKFFEDVSSCKSFLKEMYSPIPISKSDEDLEFQCYYNMGAAQNDLNLCDSAQTMVKEAIESENEDFLRRNPRAFYDSISSSCYLPTIIQNAIET